MENVKEIVSSSENECDKQHSGKSTKVPCRQKYLQGIIQKLAEQKIHKKIGVVLMNGRKESKYVLSGFVSRRLNARIKLDSLATLLIVNNMVTSHKNGKGNDTSLVIPHKSDNKQII